MRAKSSGKVSLMFVLGESTACTGMPQASASPASSVPCTSFDADRRAVLGGARERAADRRDVEEGAGCVVNGDERGVDAAVAECQVGARAGVLPRLAALDHGADARAFESRTERRQAGLDRRAVECEHAAAVPGHAREALCAPEPDRKAVDLEPALRDVGSQARAAAGG